MNKRLFSILLFAIVLLQINIANAFQITAFKALHADANGVIGVYQNATFVETFTIDISREVTGTNTFEDVDMMVYIVYTKPGLPDESLFTFAVTSGDFSGPSFHTAFNVPIVAGHIGGVISLKYVSTLNSGVASTTYTTAELSTSPPPPPTPVYDKTLDGQFYRDGSNGAIYVCIEGTWRHIFTLGTLQKLFDNPWIRDTPKQAPFGFTGTRVGGQLTTDNALWVDRRTGKVYWRENHKLRWITSMSVKSKYSFNWNSLTYVNSIPSDYTIGPDLY